MRKLKTLRDYGEATYWQHVLHLFMNLPVLLRPFPSEVREILDAIFKVTKIMLMMAFAIILVIAFPISIPIAAYLQLRYFRKELAECEERERTAK